MKILASIFKKIKGLPKKFLITGIIIIFALIYFFFFRGPQEEKLETAQVKRQDIVSTVSASGKVAGKDTVNLRFLQGGKLAFINFKKNDRVEAGQTIAGLDTQSEVIALQQAENTLRAQQANVDKVLDDIHLFQYGNGGFTNIGSPNETMTQRQTRTSAEAARDNAFDSVKAAQRNFQDAFVIAPFSGLITQTNVFPGQFVSPADTVAQVIDNSQIFFDAEVDETELNKIALGQETEISLNAFPDQTFPGIINQILPQSSITATQATVVIARVLFKPPVNFVFGTEGQASIITAKNKNVLAIPIEALRPDNTVVIQSQTGLSAVKIKTGIRSDSDVEIKEGLSEGQTIVTDPPTELPIRKPTPLNRIFRFVRRN